MKFITLNALNLGLAAALMGGAAIANEDGRSAFLDWDTNNNQVLSREEWSAGMRQAGLFDELDQNQSGYIEENEYNERLGEYNQDEPVWDLDGDGVLDREETDEGLYNAYDEDRSGGIEEDEYGNFDNEWNDYGA